MVNNTMIGAIRAYPVGGEETPAMSGFDGNHPRKVVDMLTVLVMLEHCEPTMTRVVFWRTNSAPPAWQAQVPVQLTTCLKCAGVHTGGSWKADWRVNILDALKAGRIWIEEVGPFPDGGECPTCRPLSKLPEVNPNWLNKLGV